MFVTILTILTETDCLISLGFYSQGELILNLYQVFTF